MSSITYKWPVCMLRIGALYSLYLILIDLSCSPRTSAFLKKSLRDRSFSHTKKVRKSNIHRTVSVENTSCLLSEVTHLAVIVQKYLARFKTLTKTASLTSLILSMQNPLYDAIDFVADLVLGGMLSSVYFDL